MKTYEGSCHCGAISFRFQEDEIRDGVRCNCSICRRKGAVMSVFTLAPDKIDIEIEKGLLGMYEFDTKIAKHYFCKQCGIYPFHQTLRMPGSYRVNLGCIDSVDIYALNVDIFDGKSI